ncbi:MAG: SDR family NAD(P)-dependent oxidoreductase [Candidatus Thorarchaeota archaeon]
MDLDEKFLEGKGALITGGASGFGKGFAFAYAKRGADLVLADINEELLEETTKKVESETGQKVIPIICDVSKSDQVESMAKQAFKELDNIYILNNNAGAGTGFYKDPFRIKDELFDKTIELNLKGQWIVAKEISKRMKKQNIEPLRGKIIHTASIAGVRVDPGIPAYSICKAGVIAMMQILAQSLAPKITVNAISPGYHLTGAYRNNLDVMKMTMDDGHVKTPLNRYGTVEDIVNISLFIASSMSNFITGHNFIVDGGIVEVGVPAHYLKSDL